MSAHRVDMPTPDVALSGQMSGRTARGTAGRFLRRSAAAALLLATCFVSPARANDSVAGVGAGGLILGRTDAIEMASENLYISMDEVRVDYVFRNRTDKAVETIVAFPMPDIAANPYTMPSLPDNASDNFLDFQVGFDGRPVRPQLEQRAFAVGVDVTPLLTEHKIPATPFLEATFKALEGLPEPVANDWIDRGLIFIDSYDNGDGWKNVRTPLWTLKSTYWWKSTFPAGKDVKVAHRYKPSVAASVGLNFFYDQTFQPSYQEYKQSYCTDQGFERIVKKAAAGNPDGYPPFSEYHVDYVLTTGGNWALGNIGKFKLTIDKGDPANIVSFCGTNVKKTGPTTFEMSEDDFYPQRDLKVLILVPHAVDRALPAGTTKQKRLRPPPGTRG